MIIGLSGVQFGPILLVARMITDEIGRHEVLLPINHNHYNFRKAKKCNLKNGTLFLW